MGLYRSVPCKIFKIAVDVRKYVTCNGSIHVACRTIPALYNSIFLRLKIIAFDIGEQLTSAGHLRYSVIFMACFMFITRTFISGPAYVLKSSSLCRQNSD